MRKQTFDILAAFLLLSTTAGSAQTGCVDSPENPTVIFGLIAAAVLLLVRLRRRKALRNK